MEKKDKEFADEYLSSLVDLTVNSKPLIDMLTILAEENIEHGQVIVDAVEQHISKVTAEYKLPVLYLIDSIVKNVGREYATLFSHSIVNIFCGVFEKVNEKVRQKMFTLRQTWNEVFPQPKLYALDVKVNHMDPGWPITAKVTPSIHVNPNFFKSKAEKDMQTQLRDKQRELLELQKRKLELELAATKKHIEEQEKQLNLQTASVTNVLPTPVATAVVEPTPAVPVNSVPSKLIAHGGGLPVNQINMVAQRPQPIIPSLASVAPLQPPIQQQQQQQQQRPRVAPVNPALISSVRGVIRDPRLARQMQQTSNQQNQSSSNQQRTTNSVNKPRSIFGSGLRFTRITPSAGGGGGGPSASTTTPQGTSTDLSEGGDNFLQPVELSLQTLPPLDNEVTKSIKGLARFGTAVASSSSSSSTLKDKYGNNSNSSRSSSKNLKKSSNSSQKSSSGRTSSSSIRSSKSSSTRSSSSSSSSKSSARDKNTSDRSGSSSKTSSKLGSNMSEKRRCSTTNVSPNAGSLSKDIKTSPTTKISGFDTKVSSTSNLINNEVNIDSVTTVTATTNNIDSDSLPKFKDSKLLTKGRNYSRRNRELSKSPPVPPTISHKDIDLRLSPAKIGERISTTVVPAAVALSTTVAVISPNTDNDLGEIKKSSKSPTTVTSTTSDLLSGGGGIISSLNAKTAELGGVVTNIKKQPMENNQDKSADKNNLVHDDPMELGENKVFDSPSKKMEEPAIRLTKKRESLDGILNEEPLQKKSKADGADVSLFFGSKDVDLRIKLAPPPPPTITSAAMEVHIDKNDWTGVKEENAAPTLDAVRAKFAQARKNNAIKKRRASPLTTGASGVVVSPSESPPQSQTGSKDVDLRIRPPPVLSNLQQLPQEESSQDAKYNMIVSQAQSQYDNKLITLEQYNTLIQQVMQIQESQKRGSLKRKNNDTISKQMKVVSSDDENAVLSSTSSAGDIDLRSVTNSGHSRIRKRDRQSSTNSDLVSTMDSKSYKKGDRSRKSKWSSPWDKLTPQQQQQQILLQQQQQQQQIGLFAQQQQQQMFLPGPFTGIGGGGGVSGVVNSSSWPIGQQQQLPTFNGPQQQIGISTPVWQQQSQQNMQLPSFNNQINPINTSNLSAACRSITIDGIAREIRFYDEVAIAFMNEHGTEPCEIGFQAGERRIIVDKKDTIVLAFNDTYKPFRIDGDLYQIRFGSPIRELYINNQWYECFFGDPPAIISLDGKQRVFQIEGPSPQVRIGNLRKDLVIGKVDLYIDAMVKIPLFLDGQIQQFELDQQIYSIQFADYFLTALIDGVAFTVEYGGMPKRFRIGGHDRYIRFSVMPDGNMAGKIYIKNMRRTDNHRGIVSPLPPPLMAEKIHPPTSSSLPPTTQPPPTTITSDHQQNNQSNVDSYSLLATTIPSALPSINIDDLFQKLLASGILNSNKSNDSNAMTTNTGAPSTGSGDQTGMDNHKEKEKSTPIDLSKPETLKKRQIGHIDVLFSGMQCSSCGVRFPPEQTMKYSQHLDWHFRQNRRDRDSARRPHSRRWYYEVADWIQYEEIEDLDEREKNWFETQQLEMEPQNEDSAQQNEAPVPSCVAGPDDVDKTCDMCHDPFETFYNEESEDWHLRNAIRVDDCTYHPICYEDFKASLNVEKLKENTNRPEDTDDNAVDIIIKLDDTVIDESDRIVLEDDDDDIACKDDDDDVIVMPNELPTVTEIPDEDDIVIENDTEKTKSKDDETCVDKQGGNDTEKAVSNSKDQIEVEANYEPIGNESDIQILVPQISVLDLDEFEEKPIDPESIAEALAKNEIKIKKEPNYEGYEDEDDGFEDVGTFEEAGIIDDDSIGGDIQNTDSQHNQPLLVSTTPADSVISTALPGPSSSLFSSLMNSTSTIAGTSSTATSSTTPSSTADGISTAANTQSATTFTATNTSTIAQSMITSLDGNVQLQDTTPAIATNKIKINITKNVSKISINSSENINNEKLSEDIHNSGSSNSQNISVVVAGGGGGSGNSGISSQNIDGGLNIANSAAAATAAAAAAVVQEQEISFEYKSTMKGSTFKKQLIVRDGLETSGLCSIM